MRPKCRAHGRDIFRCGKCLPEAYWPKGWHACRCGVLIPKDEHTCWKCLDWDNQDWRTTAHAERRTRHAVIRQGNA